MSQISQPQSEAAPLTEPADEAATRTPSLLADTWALSKPRITFMVVVTAYVGYALGTPAEAWGWGLPASGGVSGVLWMCNALMGVALCCVAAGVLNQIYERDIDAKMPRTKDRPLPARRIGRGYAAAFGLSAGTLGMVMLVGGHNVITAGLAVFTMASYAFVYTPLKQVTWWATPIGAVPGAMPPVLGYTAASGELDLTAAALFGILFFWQLPHFHAIGWLYRHDYRRAGLPILAVVDPSGRRTFRQSLVVCVLLLGVGATPYLLGVAGLWYLVGSTLLGLWFLHAAIRLVQSGSTERARSLFHVSLLYLPLVLLLIVVNRVG